MPSSLMVPTLLQHFWMIPIIFLDTDWAMEGSNLSTRFDKMQINPSSSGDVWSTMSVAEARYSALVNVLWRSQHSHPTRIQYRNPSCKHAIQTMFIRSVKGVHDSAAACTLHRFARSDNGVQDGAIAGMHCDCLLWLPEHRQSGRMGP
jgi:hypothetical protein